MKEENHPPLIPPGYKQTEVGVIPEDWEVKTLGSLTILLTNGFVGTATTAYVENDDGVLYIQGYNVLENSFNFHGIKRVSKDFHARNKKSCLQTGDLLTIQTGDVGVTTVVPPELAGANCHALIISRLKKQNSEPGYYCQYFNSERGRAAFKVIETGTTMKHLNGGDMKQLFLPSPPVEEQRAIATALSDVDALLDGLDRLITKKRNLKQAAMQQLLTGKTRLPGFSGEWEDTSLGQLATLRNGYAFKSSTYTNNGMFRVITIANVQDGRMDLAECNTVTDLPNDLQPHHQLSIGDLLISMTGNVGRVCRVTHSLCLLNQRVGLIYPTAVFSEFLFHLLKQRSFLTSMIGKAKGGAQGNLSKNDILDYTLLVPTDPKEQTAIATVLSDMDAEIAALEARRDKTRNIKQGMMQELLTGKTRLV